MPINRMNRTEFFEKLSGLDEQRLKTALWNLYWRGAAPVRERIEAELQPSPPGQPRRPAAASVDPKSVRDDFPLIDALVSAIRQLVLQAPAPVLADALGFHQTSTARQVTNAGATWSRYASGVETYSD